MKIIIQKIKKRHPYKTKELVKILGISIGAIRNWTKKGQLKVLNPGSTPLYILGQDFIDFYKGKIRKRRFKLGPDEFLCLRCRKPRKSKDGKVSITKTGTRVGKIKYKSIKSGECPVCGLQMRRWGSYSRDGDG